MNTKVFKSKTTTRFLFFSLILICFFQFSLFAHANQSYRLSGPISVEKASLLEQIGIIVQADLNSFLKNGDFDIVIRDLYSPKTLTLTNAKLGFPIARNLSFDKIFLQNALENNPSDITLVTNKNNRTVVLDKFTIPAIENDPFLTSYYRFTITEDDKWFIVFSDKILLAYSLQNKNWLQLINIKNNYEQLLELDPKKVIEYLPAQTGTFVVKKVNTQNNDFKTSYFKINLKDPSKFETLSLNNYQSFLTPKKNLITIDQFTGEVKTLNLNNDRLQSFKIPLIKSQNLNIEYSTDSSFNFFTNELEQLIALNKNGTLRIYKLDGALEQELQFAKISSISIASDGSGVFVKSYESNNILFYDLELRHFIQLPKILKPISGFTHTTVVNKQFYFPLLDLAGGSEAQFIKVSFQAIEDHQIEALINSTSPKKIIEQNTSLIFQLIENPKIYSNTKSLLNSITILPEFGQKSNLILSSINNFFSYLDSQNFELMKSYLQNLTPYFKTLKESVRDQIAENFAVTFTNTIRFTSSYEDVNPSKFANLMKEFLKPMFDLPSIPRTDLILSRKGHLINPQILATQPIDHDDLSQSPYGFYLKDLPGFQVKLDENHNFNYDWKMQNQNIHAIGRAQITDLSHYINTSPAPSYDQLWSDKKLSGAFILSSNLLNDFEPLVAKIVSYYTKEGFNFGPLIPQKPRSTLNIIDGILQAIWLPTEKLKIADGKSWLQQKIQNGQLDYLVKEAHSGGNDEVIWLAKNNILIKGARTLKNHMTEEVYILYPSQIAPEQHGKEIPISTNEFGQWMRERENQKGQELVFINASCWSAASAKREIISARSQLLVEIATNSTTQTFQNKPDNHERLVVDSLRKNKSYDVIKTSLEMIQTSKNPFIFPNDSEYNQLIWSGINSALDYEINIQAEE